MTNNEAIKIITSDINGDVTLKKITVEPITSHETGRVNSYYVECDFDAVSSFMHAPSDRLIEYTATYKRKAIISKTAIIAKL